MPGSAIRESTLAPLRAFSFVWTLDLRSPPLFRYTADRLQAPNCQTIRQATLARTHARTQVHSSPDALPPSIRGHGMRIGHPSPPPPRSHSTLPCHVVLCCAMLCCAVLQSNIISRTTMRRTPYWGPVAPVSVVVPRPAPACTPSQ